MSLSIRVALPEDAVAACQVLRRSISECCVQDHQHCPDMLAAWLGNKTPDKVAGWFASPSHFSVVAERDGELVGVALLTQAGKLSLCYVVPEALHCGIGKAMLQEIEAQARRWSVSVLRLHSTSTARAFYARHGYIHAGKDKSCYGLECDFFWKKLGEADPADIEASARFCPCSQA